MKLLLDTHVLLWWLDDPSLLSFESRDAISSFQNDVFISSAVVWEIAIKQALGRLRIPNNLQQAIRECGFQELQITFQHALGVSQLESHHRDPFDRLLISQAIHVI